MAMFEKDRERSLDVLRKAQGLAQKGLADIRHSVVPEAVVDFSRQTIPLLERGKFFNLISVLTKLVVRVFQLGD